MPTPTSLGMTKGHVCPDRHTSLGSSWEWWPVFKQSPAQVLPSRGPRHPRALLPCRQCAARGLARSSAEPFKRRHLSARVSVCVSPACVPPALLSWERPTAGLPSLALTADTSAPPAVVLRAPQGSWGLVGPSVPLPGAAGTKAGRRLGWRREPHSRG